ncbi:DUF6538 domain-containing protein [Gemmobacter megaterium]|nr:DUF6538 domain-containing protein [Gemmobacter megaterium]
MSRPHKHPKTGVYYFRQKTPADLREKFGKPDASWSLRTKDTVEAKARHAEAQAKQNKVWAALRAEPKGLALREIVALVGTYRRELDSIVEAETGEPAVWDQVLRLEGQAGESAQALEGWHGDDANRLLLEQGLVIDDYSRQRLLNEMHKAWLEWAEFQRRRSVGDFRPDATLERYPAPEKAQRAAPKVTLTSLLDLWEAQQRTKPGGGSDKTIADFRAKVAKLIAYLGHDDAMSVTPLKVDEWCDSLVQAGVSARTVSDKYLAAVKAVFGVGVDKNRLDKNPLADKRYKYYKPNKERPSGYTDAEAARVLTAALVDPKELGKRFEHNKLAIRWLPWICAYTGARITETAQLRGDDFITEAGVPCLRITPEAGSVKSGSYRIVPVHEHLMEMGLADLFKASVSRPVVTDPKPTREQALSAAQSVGKKVAEWVRDVVGIEDRRIKPNHAWRHRFKTICRDVGIDKETRDAFQGHADGTSAANYGEVTIKAMTRAMANFPRVDLSLNADETPDVM